MPANKRDGIGDGSQIVSVRLLALNLKIKNNGTPMVRPNPLEGIYSLKVSPIKHGRRRKSISGEVFHKKVNLKNNK